MERISHKLHFAIVIAVLLFAFFLYYKSLNFFFFQDDFFEILISKADSMGDFLSFFKFRDDIIAYRPISLQTYFFSASSLFGLNPLGFRVITMFFLSISYLAIFKIFFKITKNKPVAILTSTLWILSSIHFMAVTWIAAAYNIIGTFFWLLTALMFLKFEESAEKKFYILSLLTFILTICSFEFSVTWPAIFGFYYFYIKKKPLINSFKIFSPFIIIAIIYLILRWFFIRVPQISEYEMTFNINSLKALLWYFLWTFNIPEEFKKQIIDNLLIFNPKFLEDYWFLVLISFVSSLYIIFLSSLALIKAVRNHIAINFNLIIFALFWFVAAISPVLLLPNHTFSMYLTLASIGIYFLIAYFLALKPNVYLISTVFIIWLFSSYTTLSFYKNNSWMVEAQQFARNFAFGIKKTYPILPSSSQIYFYHPDKRHIQALSENNAIKVIYNDLSLSIYYRKEDLIKNQEYISTRPFFIFHFE